MKKSINIVEKFPTITTRGEIEFVIKDKFGRVIDVIRDHNIVKIFAKEVISHRIPHSKVWDPEAGTAGDWVDSNIDKDEEFSIKYIIFGASFDANGVPLDSNDTRYYTIDTVTGLPVPIRLEAGAYYDGELINAIPISEPNRPLKRVERIAFEPTYQPAGTPLLQEDVRAVNNIALFETTLKLEEYNGFGASDSDYFTITEVALVAAREIGLVGACEKTPKEIFLEGSAGTLDGIPIPGEATGGDVVSIDDIANVALIKEGDQIKITSATPDTSGEYGTLGQISPYYLVLSKSSTGKELQLDRVPADSSNVPLTGDIGIYRSTLRIFSHRVLKSPVKKSGDFQIDVRWKIILS